MRFHEYDEATGEFTGRSIGGSEGWQPTPRPGKGFTRADSIDPRRQRVRLVDDGLGGEAVPVLVRRLPDRPHDTDLVKWEWSEDLQDWAAVLTDAGRLRELRSERDRLLSVTDVAVRGGLERLLVDVAIQLGMPVDASLEALLSYRQQLRDAPARPDFSALQPADLALPPSQE